MFALEDGLKLVATRARLMQELPRNGRMVAVLADESRVVAALAGLEDGVALAAVNGPQQAVISGLAEALEIAVSRLERQAIVTRRLNVSHAFHSPLMEPMLDAFRQVAETIKYGRPQVRLISNLTGGAVDQRMPGADYWVQHVRHPVRFADGMAALFAEGLGAFIEIGPQATLLDLARQVWQAAGRSAAPRWLPSLDRRRPDWPCLLGSLAQLYAAGMTVDWTGFARGFAGRKAALPTSIRTRAAAANKVGWDSVPTWPGWSLNLPRSPTARLRSMPCAVN